MMTTKPVPKMRPKTPIERGEIDPESLTAALNWDTLADPGWEDAPAEPEPGAPKQ